MQDDKQARTIEVVAAVIERTGPAGREILIGQRKNRGKHALKWEFPGGKVEPGEDARAALARELWEELGIRAEIGESLDSYDYTYRPGEVTRLLFYRVSSYQGELQNLDFTQLAWERPE